MVQWLRLCALTLEGLGSIPGWGTKIPQAMWHGRKKKKKKDINLIQSQHTQWEKILANHR